VTTSTNGRTALAALVKSESESDGEGASHDAIPVALAAREGRVSEATLRRAIQAGVVEAVRDGGRLVVRRSEVVELRGRLRKRVPTSAIERERASGELAALAFERFEACTPLDRVVVELKALPDTIRELFSQWVALRETSARWLAKPPGPMPIVELARFDHPEAPTCCEGHEAARRTRERRTA
jgi:hypothetical protein